MREDFRPSERVAIAAAVAEKVGERRGNGNVQNIAQYEGQKTRTIAAEKAGFGNPETLRQAKAVVATNDIELIEAMDSGKLSISAAAKWARPICTSRLPCQQKYLDKFVKIAYGRLSTAAAKTATPEDRKSGAILHPCEIT